MLMQEGNSMQLTAKLFANGRSQAVRLPSIFRFEGQEVFIRKDASTGDVRVNQGHSEVPERDPFEPLPSSLQP
jgi:hypothetical protein